MFVVDPRKSVAHLFAPDGHREEPQRRIVETVIVLVSVIFHAIIERQIPTEESCPRIGRPRAGRQAPGFFQSLLSPVESVDDVVLVTDVPGILPDPAAELNPTEK